jgi:hypothetical protein
VTIVDNQFYVNIIVNANLVNNFKHIPIFSDLEKLVGGETFDTLMNVIFNFLLVFLGLPCARD